jgi:hypothetical protein
LAAEPLRYEPVVIRLSGVIVIEAFFGPPGYGEDPENDEIERALILVLDEPVAVQGDPNDSLNSESVDDVRRIHLVIRHPEIWAKEWQHVVLEGTLFHRLTGHHRTPVLMSADRLVSSP